jgi:hypothetical protein
LFDPPDDIRKGRKLGPIFNVLHKASVVDDVDVGSCNRFELVGKVSSSRRKAIDDDARDFPGLDKRDAVVIPFRSRDIRKMSGKPSISEAERMPIQSRCATSNTGTSPGFMYRVESHWLTGILGMFVFGAGPSDKFVSHRLAMMQIMMNKSVKAGVLA